MGNKTILIVDDEEKIQSMLSHFLQKEGYRVVAAAGGRQALELFMTLQKEIDLILLEVMLPEYDGWTVCREIRKQSKVPIIILTGRSEDFDEIHGFEIGADDYVKKPINPTVLIARINAFFRRLDKDKAKEERLIFEDLEIDDALHSVKVCKKEISLSPKEYNILHILVENNGRIVSREQLLNQVWGYDYYGGLRTVDTHINRLRIKLGEKGTVINTIRGFGYKFGA